MKKNMGTFDRLFRILVAAVAINLYVTDLVTGVWDTVLIVLAAVFIVTSAVGVCPLYLPFGISTRRKGQVTK